MLSVCKYLLTLLCNKVIFFLWFLRGYLGLPDILILPYVPKLKLNMTFRFIKTKFYYRHMLTLDVEFCFTWFSIYLQKRFELDKVHRVNSILFTI